MHPQLVPVGMLWIAVLGAVLLVHVITTRSMLTRILALDVLTTLLVGLLALYADLTDSAYALDAALVLAALAFVGTLAAARFYSRGGLFR
jgi:multicomponent Na+:H+ antiporter subunit F